MPVYDRGTGENGKLRLSLDQAASSLLRQLPDELSPILRSLFSARSIFLAPGTHSASSDKRMRLTLE